MSTVLGVTLSHYSGAALVKDGELVAAVAEERLNREKFSVAFPTLSIRSVLQIAGVRPEQVDLVALGTRCERFDSNRAQAGEYRLTTNLVSAASRFVPTSILGSEALRQVYLATMSRVRSWERANKDKRFWDELGFDPRKIRVYDHHDCHAASAFYTRPQSGPALVLTCDGNGDGLCATVSVGQDGHFERKIAVNSMHSIAGFYAQVTRFLGMKPWQDEYKVMGVAPYADPRKGRDILELFRRMWKVDGLGFRNDSGRACAAMVSYLNRKVPNRRFDYVSWALQAIFEEIVVAWVRNNVEHFKLGSVSAAGGGFLNIRANSKIVELPEVDQLHVFPAAGDDGISVGAAYMGYREMCLRKGESVRHVPMKDAYLGPALPEDLDEFVQTLDPARFRVEKPENIAERVADLLAQGQVVGRASGRMEFGPRALGNRSLLANPSRLEAIRQLNAMIKQRDFWMPFAPSIMEEHAKDYVINPKGHAAPYMLLSFDTTERSGEIAAGCHQGDLSCRPQIVSREQNPEYHAILEAFHRKTGIGGVMNTSFNLHGDPIVASAKDAVGVLEKSGLRHLVIGPYLVIKQRSAP
jgi:carbamoyltransferase